MIGDPVIVEMASNDAFPWMRAPRFEARLAHRPDGPGDIFRFYVPGIGNVEINGNSSVFVGFWPWHADWRSVGSQLLAQNLPQ